MLKIAKESAPNADFLLGDFYQLPFPDAHFDCFWAVASFLHVPKADLPKVLKEARRVTMKHGFGVVAVKERVEFNEGVISETKAGGIERYFAFYSEPEMRKALEANDLTVKEVTRERENDEDQTMWLCFFVQKNC